MRVAIYGAGQAGTAVAGLLGRRGVTVDGPFGRDGRRAALESGADVVVIATTSFLTEIADDVRAAVAAGSNVLTTAEEAADPWAADPALADALDREARARGVTILGAGLNPGFAFDALVLTAIGACADVHALHVERVVDLSGFGATILRRLGVGFAPDAFAAGVAAGTITGHIGFPQSMRVVARALGVEIERIDRTIEPLLAGGRSAGFVQRYVAIVAGAPWFAADFTGHVDPAGAGLSTRDVVEIDATPPVRLEIAGGLPSQAGSAAVLANSVARVAAARPGWVTVAELPPAIPAVC
jgi:4-hydroxy-tetrahydrodipicolinate reductase